MTRPGLNLYGNQSKFKSYYIFKSLMMLLRLGANYLIIPVLNKTSTQNNFLKKFDDPVKKADKHYQYETAMTTYHV